MAERRAGFTRHDFLWVSLLLLISAGIFWLDLLIPLGVAAGVPYIAVVFLGAWMRWRHGIILLAAIGTILTLLGYLSSEPGGIAWMVVANRGLALFAIWVTAFLLMQRRGAEEALKAVRDGLEDRVAERTAELEKANADLRESEERFKDFANSASDWLWELDSQFRFMLDTRPQSLVGLEIDDILGKTRWELPGTDPEDETWRQHRVDLEAHKTIRNFEFSFQGKNGDRRYTRINGKPMYDSEGKFAGYRGTASDITNIRLAEERFRQTQKMEAIGQLTGGVAHDFNNLLAVILGHAEIAEERLGENDDSVSTIIRAAERGAELTQRLLAFSRRQSLDSKPIDLGALVGNVHQLLHRTLGETIDIEIAMAPSLWNAVADSGQLENALLNLALNARDAMPDGGKLIIEAANVSLSTNDAASHMEVPPGDYVSLLVRDTGVGMPPEVMEHAFEPFFTTKDVGEGSGLGLSMVYGFAKQSGGDATIESDPGRGTTVKLFLPRAKGAVEQPKQSDAPSVPKARGETVLLVEDEPDVRTMAETMLENLGYRVLSAESARAGLDILRTGPAIDLLLSDVVLPGSMSGPDMTEHAKAIAPGIKVLFMSGHAEPSIHFRTPLPEGSDLLDKPFRTIELAQRVRAVLDR